MSIYPDPILNGLLDESAHLEYLLQSERTVQTNLLYASNDTREIFQKRLTEVRRQIAVLREEPA